VKNIWLILLALVAGIVLGRLSVEPKVVTETVTEYHTLNTSALTAIKVSEPIGSREVKVMLRKNLFPNIDQVGDVRENNFLNINQIGDSTEMVKKHLRDSTKMVDHIEESLEMVDSATVELPIRDYTFTDDSTYTITARGVYVESLPQIEFTPRIVTTTRTETVVRAPRITHGFQLGAGAALTPKGLQPAMYVGYGFSIKF
jgi:hypothetical protein